MPLFRKRSAKAAIEAGSVSSIGSTVAMRPDGRLCLLDVAGRNDDPRSGRGEHSRRLEADPGGASGDDDRPSAQVVPADDVGGGRGRVEIGRDGTWGLGMRACITAPCPRAGHLAPGQLSATAAARSPGHRQESIPGSWPACGRATSPDGRWRGVPPPRRGYRERDGHAPLHAQECSMLERAILVATSLAAIGSGLTAGVFLASRSASGSPR